MSTQVKPTPANESVPYASIATPSAEERIPMWVGVMVAVVIAGSMLGGGGLWFWSYHNRPDPKSLTEVRSSVTTGNISRAPVSAPVQNKTIAPGIQQTSPTNYNVTGGDFSLVISKQATATDWTLNLLYRKSDLLTADQQAARTARLRLANDPLFAKSLKVTDEQVAKLKALPAVTPTTTRLTPTSADNDRLKKMWTALIAGNPPKPAEAAKLVAAVDQIGKANVESLRKSLVDGVKDIQAILTPEQIAAFKQ